MSEAKFFVVRRDHGREHYCIEHGDFAGRYAKEDRAAILYRAELPEGWRLILNQTIELYRRGVRAKPKEKTNGR